MTAAELRAAAEYFASHEHCECDREVGIFNCIGCDIGRMASHILATVRSDDGEPVTVEWYREAGFSNSCIDDSIVAGGGVLIVDPEWLDVTVCNGKPKVPTRGDVRKLAMALGIELKEPQ